MAIKAIVTIVCIVEGLVGSDLEVIETFADLVVLGWTSVTERGSQVLLTNSRLRLVLDVCGQALNGAVVERVELFE